MSYSMYTLEVDLNYPIRLVAFLEDRTDSAGEDRGWSDHKVDPMWRKRPEDRIVVQLRGSDVLGNSCWYEDRVQEVSDILLKKLERAVIQSLADKRDPRNPSPMVLIDNIRDPELMGTSGIGRLVLYRERYDDAMAIERLNITGDGWSSSWCSWRNLPRYPLALLLLDWLRINGTGNYRPCRHILPVQSPTP